MDSKLFEIKICGVTDSDGVRAVASSCADALGLNFYGHSPRYLNLESARRLAEEVPADVQKVGLFVDESAAHIRHVVKYLKLDWIQLHGNEPPEFLESLAEAPVLRAFRVRDAQLEPVVRYLERCDQLNCRPQAILLDAYAADQLGGTGKSLDWNTLSEMISQLGDVHWVLAGGLSEFNVAEAIRHAKPHAVDVASGVELSPGRKDPGKVKKFADSARSAFCGLQR